MPTTVDDTGESPAVVVTDSAGNELYRVTAAEVWDVMEVPAEARTSDDPVIQNIKEAVLIVEDIAGPTVPPEDRKTVVVSMAGQYTVDGQGEGIAESMDALDVSIDYDTDAQLERLTSKTERLLDAIREKGRFVFRSF